MISIALPAISIDRRGRAKSTCLISCRANLAETWNVCFNDGRAAERSEPGDERVRLCRAHEGGQIPLRN